ncbi:MAG TPA: methyltransferase domain-containing protein [Anaeromyxobacteraceae bacterium]|nr:methyltransferase domain-containing protein [Anaeromyxobacteraceae bacterium]
MTRERPAAVDKARLREAFSRGAAAYEERALLQRAIAARVLALAAESAPGARRALDVGCGAGGLLEGLRARLPALAATGVDLAPGMARTCRDRLGPAAAAVGDAEALPFRSGAFDLVVSSSTFQWVSLDAALAEVRRVLAPGATFCLALFCGDTLFELRDAWRAALPPDVAAATHAFASPARIRDALARADLPPVRFEVERRVERHASPRDLVESLRAIGAGNAVAGRRGGLGLARAVSEMSRIYSERHGREGAVPATWETAYAVARAP